MIYKREEKKHCYCRSRDVLFWENRCKSDLPILLFQKRYNM